ncbi:ribokinase [Aeribacillus pallidus]|uniref:ribokinase n=1 Tax=Aeribacillus pallidus TaxID=33936 RepID=UPI003D1D127A
MKQPTVVVIGSINMDLVTESPRVPEKGETILGEKFHLIPGGKGANQAVAAARLGAQVKIIGAVGTDSFGTELLAHLKNEGIDVSNVKPVTSVSTGVASITLSEGDNRIIVVPGANHLITPNDIEQCESVFANADVCVLQLEIPLETVEKAVEIAKKHGIKVILNPAPAQTLPLFLLEKVDYLTPNEHERPLIFGDTQEEAFIEKLIVTEGKAGVSYYKQGKKVQVSGYSVDVVDTTGAGDTFNGAFAVAISRGMSLAEACAFANAAAALSVTQLGAQTGMPTQEQLEQFLQEQEAKQ